MEAQVKKEENEEECMGKGTKERWESERGLEIGEGRMKQGKREGGV